MYDKVYQHVCKSLKDTSDLTRVTIMGHIPYLFSEKSRDFISPFILSLISFLSFSPTSFSLLNRSRSFIYCFIPSFFPSFKQGQVLNFKISFKMVPRHPLGPRTERCCHLSPCQRGSPWSPALFSSPAPQEPAARSLPHTLASGTLPQGLRPFPLSQGPPRPAPPLPCPPFPSRIPASWAHLFAYFYLCSPPAANQRAGRGGGLGGARAPTLSSAAAAAGSRAGRNRRGRDARCSHCPSPGLPTASPLLRRLGQAPKARTKRLPGGSAGARLYLQLPGTSGSKMVCGGFACSKNCLCALNLLYTVSIPSPFLPAWGLCTCSGAPWLPCLANDSHFIPHPLSVFPRSGLPRPASPSVPAGDQEPATVAVFSFHCEAAVFLAHWPRLFPIALPRPLTHRLVFQLFDQTSPLSHPYTFCNSLLASKSIRGGFGGGSRLGFEDSFAKIAWSETDKAAYGWCASCLALRAPVILIEATV